MTVYVVCELNYMFPLFLILCICPFDSLLLTILIRSSQCYCCSCDKVVCRLDSSERHPPAHWQLSAIDRTPLIVSLEVYFLVYQYARSKAVLSHHLLSPGTGSPRFVSRNQRFG